MFFVNFIGDEDLIGEFVEEDEEVEFEREREVFLEERGERKVEKRERGN